METKTEYETPSVEVTTFAGGEFARSGGSGIELPDHEW